MGSFFSLLFNILFSSFIDSLPALDVPLITLPDEIYNIFDILWYFVPQDTCLNLFAAGLAITLFRLAIAIIIRIKSFIPTMGA